MPPLKRIIAREWLYLLGWLFVGILPLPLVVMLVSLLFFPHVGSKATLAQLYDELMNGVIGDWLFVLAPYLLFQFVRSIIWAIRSVRGGSS